MTSRYASVLHALSVEPRTARPGETVRMVFRTRNFAAVPSPPGTVRFLPAAGLDVVADAIVPVDSVAPGDEVVAEIVARVVHPMDDGTTLEVQAVLVVDGASLGTNVCAVVVRSCAVLDGALSGTFVEAIGDDTVRVRAVVTNEGDGPACDVRIVVPSPVGCVALDDGPGGSLETPVATKAVARIDAGERAEIAFDARIVEPAVVVCADGAYVELVGGTRLPIPARDEVLLRPRVTRPDVHVTPSRRRVDVSASVRNDGWADACDVRVRIALPAELRLVEGSVLVDGVPVAPRVGRGKSRDTAFARLEKADGALVVAIGRVPAQGTADLFLAAQVPVGFDGGELTVGIGPAGTSVVVPFVVEPVRELRVRVVDVPRIVVAGERATMAAEISNLGDVPETVTVRAVMRDLVLDEDACTLTVQPGHVAVATLAFDVPETRGDARLPVAVVVSDAERERARAQHAVVVRAVAASAAAAVAPAVVPDTARAAAVRAVLVAPSGALAGAPFSVRLILDVAEPMERLTIRAPAPLAATYVAGSTVLDGCVLLDRDGSSPLHGDGLTLRDLRGSTHIAVTWSLLAAAGADVPALDLAALLEADGTVVRIEPATVPVRAAAAFSVRPARLPYHVDARAADDPDVGQIAFGEDDRCERVAPVSREAFDVAETRRDAGVAALLHDIGIGTTLHDIGVSAAAPQTGSDTSTFVLRLDGGRVEEIARAMRGAGANTLISHVVALRALLPDIDASRSTAIDRALEDAATATHDVFDRLFVKLRIPGFGVEASDLEDQTMRRALVGLFRALGHDSTVAAFADAPLGSAEVLRALVTLVPARGDAEPLLGAALRFYACALDEALAHLTNIPLELYEVALARDAGFRLADARAAVVSALPAAALPGAA